ncbi:MAG: PaaI family thioesterase [Clostridia bacterium]|nr:PaaI family thioesterase [Clostridia bacterium]
MKISSNEILREEMEAAIVRANEDKTMMNGMLGGKLVDCDYEEKSATIEYETQHWENNRAGYVHGGIIASILDLTMGDLSITYSDEVWTPTVNLQVSYVRPIKMGDAILCKAYVVSDGKRLNQMRSEAYSRDTGKLLATATGVYFCTDTRKEHGVPVKGLA